MASKLIRHLETFYGTTQNDGHTLKIDFDKWYETRKGEIKFYFWSRLQRYWLSHSILPVNVVKSVDNVTDEIVGYLGDPQENKSWRRRGLVMGHVQSGKTTNYSALIAKAADAGYRVIIVLAGLTNSLRYQTQVRLNQTFVGNLHLETLLHQLFTLFPMYLRGLKEKDMLSGILIAELHRFQTSILERQPVLMLMKETLQIQFFL